MTFWNEWENKPKKSQKIQEIVYDYFCSKFSKNREIVRPKYRKETFLVKNLSVSVTESFWLESFESIDFKILRMRGRWKGGLRAAEFTVSIIYRNLYFCVLALKTNQRETRKSKMHLYQFLHVFEEKGWSCGFV